MNSFKFRWLCILVATPQRIQLPGTNALLSRYFWTSHYDLERYSELSLEDEWLQPKPHGVWLPFCWRRKVLMQKFFLIDLAGLNFGNMLTELYWNRVYTLLIVISSFEGVDVRMSALDWELLLMALRWQNVNELGRKRREALNFRTVMCRMRESSPECSGCIFGELTIDGMSFVGSKFCKRRWISISRFSHNKPASRKAIDSNVFQGRFRHEPTLMLIKIRRREIEWRYTLRHLLVGGEQLAWDIFADAGDEIVFIVRHMDHFRCSYYSHLTILLLWRHCVQEIAVCKQTR